MNIKNLIPENATSNTLVLLSMENLRDIMCECVSLVLEDCAEKKSSSEDKLLSTSEVEEILHVDRSTLWRWHKNGYLCYTKVGKKNMYKQSEVFQINK